MNGLKHIQLTPITEAAVSTMRNGEQFGQNVEELQSGNVIPKFCRAAGEGACAKTCLLVGIERDLVGVLCAENNIANVIDSVSTKPESFALVAATKDNVKFGDTVDFFKSSEGYKQVPDCNAFFFRPGIDGLTHIAMRMADCGSVVYEFSDTNGDLVLGQSHFSRSNMRGPSAFAHEYNGKKVSWSEYVLANIVEHYGVDPKEIQVTLVAAVEGKDFIHHYENIDIMEGHYPGWSELGFMHPQAEQDFDCLIDYREMIEWQLKNGVTNFDLRLNRDNVKTDSAINTGNIALGHASHHYATKGVIAHGRDMYVVGVDTDTLERQYREAHQLMEENYIAGFDDYAKDDDQRMKQIERVLGYVPRL